MHLPVMVSEVLKYLVPRPGETIVDCTVGEGGHSQKILEMILPGGRLIGIDRDEEVLVIARDRLKYFSGSFELLNRNFKNLSSILEGIKVDGLLFDLGVSSFQLKSKERGFSFRESGPLDMRMDRKEPTTAYDLVNRLSFEELVEVFKKFGEEPRANAMARAVIKVREDEPIKTTGELANLAVKVLKKKGRWQRIHPATRIFQALRITVNEELDALKEGLTSGIDCLKKGGRIVVITFHSLEDRIVKHTFRKYEDEGVISLLTPKPLCPSLTEVRENPKSRSAKLRAAEKA